MADTQPPTIVEGAISGDVDDELPVAAKSAEDRKAAAALSSLDATREDDSTTTKDIDQDAIRKAMDRLAGSGSTNGTISKKEDEKKVVKKVVKVDQADVALLVSEWMFNYLLSMRNFPSIFICQLLYIHIHSINNNALRCCSKWVDGFTKSSPCITQLPIHLYISTSTNPSTSTHSTITPWVDAVSGWLHSTISPQCTKSHPSWPISLPQPNSLYEYQQRTTHVESTSTPITSIYYMNTMLASPPLHPLSFSQQDIALSWLLSWSFVPYHTYINELTSSVSTRLRNWNSPRSRPRSCSSSMMAMHNRP